MKCDYCEAEATKEICLNERLRFFQNIFVCDDDFDPEDVVNYTVKDLK
jgi:hypothetical protein